MGEAGSLVSLLSSTTTIGGGVVRVTSNATSIITSRIATNTVTTATAILVTGQEGVALGGEGRTAATLLSPLLIMTQCKVGLHTSRTGGGAMLNPGSIWPLSKNYRSVALQKNSNY